MVTIWLQRVMTLLICVLYTGYVSGRCGSQFHLSTAVSDGEVNLDIHTLLSSRVSNSLTWCSLSCRNWGTCNAVNYHIPSSNCLLLNVHDPDFPKFWSSDTDWQYISNYYDEEYEACPCNSDEFCMNHDEKNYECIKPGK